MKSAATTAHALRPTRGAGSSVLRRSQGRADSLFRDALTVLPQGQLLPEHSWRRRHRCIVALLWLHAVGLFSFGLVEGRGAASSAAGVMVVIAAAVFASVEPLGRRARSLAASFGLVTCSALVVYMASGVIEAHFHFFVVISILVLYQDWAPFLLALAYVVVHHGLLGVIDPYAVYNHQSAVDHPWKWAMVHGAFVLAASAASAQIYRWTDEKGKVHITDTPPPPGAKNVQKHRPASAPQAVDSDPYVLQLARKNAPITLYSTPGCEPCSAARKLLNARGVPFKEVSVVDGKQIEELKAAVGSNAVPSLIDGGTVQRLVGSGLQFFDLAVRQKVAGFDLPNEEKDALVYQRAAGYTGLVQSLAGGVLEHLGGTPRPPERGVHRRRGQVLGRAKVRRPGRGDGAEAAPWNVDALDVDGRQWRA